MKKLTQPHLDLRLLIRKKALTPDGFMLHHADGMEASRYASSQACRMVLAGDLFRVKVKGQPLHYMRTQALADKMTEKLLVPKPSVPTKIGEMRVRMREFAGTPEGATWTDFAYTKMWTSTFSAVAKTLQADGQLVRAKVKGHPLRYFSTQAAADSWIRRTPPTQRQPSVYIPVVRVVKPVKLAKPPPPIKREEIFIRQIAKPVSAPKKDAVIIWPARMPECRMMPPGRYAVSVPMRRIGEAGFSMSIGGVA